MPNGVWSREELDKFLDAIKKYPQGPWRLIAGCIGTRSLHQVQIHAQKYHEKIVRHMRGLRKDRRNAIERGEHRIDDETLEVCGVGKGFRLVLPGRLQQQQPPISPRSQTQGQVGQAPYANGAADLPSLDESLDFLIKCLSAEVLSDGDLEFDLGEF